MPALLVNNPKTVGHEATNSRTGKNAIKTTNNHQYNADMHTLKLTPQCNCICVSEINCQYSKYFNCEYSCQNFLLYGIYTA